LFFDKNSFQTMLASTTQALANRHFWCTFWGGLVLALPLGFVMTSVFFTSSASYTAARLASDTAGLTGIVVTLGTLPALFFGWLRLGAMRWLFGYYLAHTTAGRRAVVVLGTLALFELSVLAGTLTLYLVWRLAIEFGLIWRICTGFSLPWLLASLWASWWVLRQPAPEAVPGVLPAG
jgi:hypothetical protein